MKKLMLAFMAAAVVAVPASLFAESKGKEITLTGEGACAKCVLKTADKCQNTLTVEKNGKKTVYYLADNETSKGFHSEICTATKKISATGTCVKQGDKLVVTASKISAAK